MLSWSLHEQLCTHPVIHYVNIVETTSVGFVHKLVLCVGVGGNLNERDQGRVLTLFNRCEWHSLIIMVIWNRVYYKTCLSEKILYIYKIVILKFMYISLFTLVYRFLRSLKVYIAQLYCANVCINWGFVTDLFCYCLNQIFFYSHTLPVWEKAYELVYG